MAFSRLAGRSAPPDASPSSAPNVYMFPDGMSHEEQTEVLDMFEAPGGTSLKVLPVRLPERDHERLRIFAQSNGFSMAVVVRTLVERFLASQGGTDPESRTG